MRSFFNLESPFMRGLNKMADMMILNLITLVCCLPIITIGASITALHFVSLKLVRDEETYIVKTFFKSFKQNFVQATVLWIIEILIGILIVFDFLIINHSGMEFPFWVNMGMIAVSALIYALGIHIFPLQSKFENKIFQTIKNSVLVGLLIFPRTILEVIVCAVPILLMYFFEQSLPIILLFGFSGPALVCALLYNKTFKRFEPEVVNTGDDWHIDDVLDGKGLPEEDISEESSENDDASGTEEVKED